MSTTMETSEMSCQELVELVTEYLEGTLPAADRQRFEDHLMGCEGCRRYLAQMGQVIGALGKLSEADIPEQAREDLLKAFRNWKRNRPAAS